MSSRIVVIGAGPAGVAAALAAKRQGPDHQVVLLSSEDIHPYEKPPLSKAVLLGGHEPAAKPIAELATLVAAGVVLERGAHATAIDRGRRQIELADRAAMPYDAAVLATGAAVRSLPVLPPGMPHVFYLRTAADAIGLRDALQKPAGLPEVVVLGAGLIGLEVAAAAASQGRRTLVLDAAKLAMARVCSAGLSELVLERHRRAGVQFHFETTIRSASPVEGGIALETSDGRVINAGLVIVGIGIRPDVALAAAAGLAVDEGVLVDAHCRTADPAIYAAGDVAQFRTEWCALPVRLENWRHALQQGQVAGTNAAGGDVAYRTVPSFWSDQYELMLQGVGWPDGLAGSPLRRSLDANQAMEFYLSDGQLRYAVGVGMAREFAAARRLIERRAVIDPAALADAGVPLQSLLAARK
jgi:NADPH-dependent 2,4-dienoyl-CoA reductase/sulfur reductase-like enzyme